MPARQAEAVDLAHESQVGSSTRRRPRVIGAVSAPLLRPGIIDRPVLVDNLVSVPHVRVVLLSAPAGYGKTTLLLLWRERDERPFAWVSLERGHNDPLALAGSLLAALDPILHLDAAIADSLNVAKPPLEDVV